MTTKTNSAKTLFDNPVARRRDPPVSHDSATAITKTGQRLTQCREILAALIAEDAPVSRRELAEHMGWQAEIVWKRISDLITNSPWWHDGAYWVVKKARARICRVSGKKVEPVYALRVLELENA